MISVKGEIKMANELLKSISKDEVERAHYRSRKMFRMDMKHDRAVSRTEGRNEKSQEIARNLLRMGVPFDTVENATGLTRAEIEKLRTES
jgi:predicted transposase/invertase (TIGR01784 family)